MSNTRDERLMAAAIRYARRNIARTKTNPSVACLIVRSENGKDQIVGRGITAIGGRPHAEPVALAEAGEKAKGATAYVTLEPCAHHGATPPCAQTLIDAGIARVVTAWVDPDARVDGKGHAMLRAAGIDVETGILANEARHDLGGYLARKQQNRPWVTLKLAVSKDGYIGIKGEGQVKITGDVSRAQVDMMRSYHDAIMVGSSTAIEDDPELICRRTSLKNRSPHRIILDSKARLSPNSRLVNSIDVASLSIVIGPNADQAKVDALQKTGANIISGELIDGRIALPEMLEDIAAMGISSLFVEGGAEVAKAFLEAGLVDEVNMFIGNRVVGENAIAAPINLETPPAGFRLVRTEHFEDDVLYVYRKGER